DGPRGHARRTRRGARDHHSRPTAAFYFLRGVVRARGAFPRSPSRRFRGLQVPPELGETLPRAGGTCRDDVSNRAAGYPLLLDRRRDRRAPRRRRKWGWLMTVGGSAMRCVRAGVIRPSPP